MTSRNTLVLRWRRFTGRGFKLDPSDNSSPDLVSNHNAAHVGFCSHQPGASTRFPNCPDIEFHLHWRRSCREHSVDEFGLFYVINYTHTHAVSGLSTRAKHMISESFLYFCIFLLVISERTQRRSSDDINHLWFGKLLLLTLSQ